MNREFPEYEKLSLKELQTELELVEDAEFRMSMSDNYCYTTGRIYPLKRKIRELKELIKEKENA